MKTAAISNPVNITSGNTSATKSSDASADTPFSQVLSREMAAQPKAKEPTKTSSVENRQQTKASRPEATSNRTKPSEKTKASAGEENKTSAATKEPADTVKDSTAPSDIDTTEQDTETGVSDASAELLALVASLTQPVAVVDQSSKTDDNANDGEQSDVSTVQTGAQLLPPVFANLGAELLRNPSAPAQPTTDAMDPVATQEVGIGLANRGEAVTGTVTTQLLNSQTQPAVAAGTKEFTGMVAQAKDEKLKPEKDQVKTLSDPAQAKDEKLVLEKDQAKTLTDSGQPKDDKPAPENKTSKILPERADRHATQPSPDTATKTQSNTQPPPPATPFNIAAMSQNQLQPAQAAASHMLDRLAPRVGAEGWDQALGQKVVWMVGGSQQSATLTLNPPDLGPLQIVLNVSDSQATAQFTAAQPEVRHALEAAMPKLREMLGEAGIQLGQSNVSAGTPNNQQNAFNQPQQSSRNSGSPSENSDMPAPATRTQVITGGQGLVDTFA
jgi:flagellar hook-length control protein FliK